MLKNNEIDARIHRKSAEIQDEIDPKWFENEAKRDKKCNHRLQDDLGSLRRPIFRLWCASKLEPKIEQKLQKNNIKNR